MLKSFIQKLSKNKSILYLLGIVSTSITFIFCLSFGTIYIPFFDIVSTLLHYIFPTSFEVDENLANIILKIRMPRVVLACLVGASLSVAGATFQGVLRNPLADPYTLGISSGASVGAVATIYFGWSFSILGNYTLPIFSIIAAILTIFIVLTFAKKVERSLRIETVILTGIIFSSFLSAFVSLMLALTNDELRAIMGWLLGSVAMRGWKYILILLPFFIIGAIILLTHTKEMDALALGEEMATFIGVDVAKKRLLLLITGAMITGAAVAVSGTIGFVGLVIPHMIRILVGPSYKHLFFLSILLGSNFLMLMDLIARTIISPQELPIGVVTAFIGAPIFAWILLRPKSRIENR